MDRDDGLYVLHVLINRGPLRHSPKGPCNAIHQPIQDMSQLAWHLDTGVPRAWAIDRILVQITSDVLIIHGGEKSAVPPPAVAAGELFLVCGRTVRFTARWQSSI